MVLLRVLSTLVGKILREQRYTLLACHLLVAVFFILGTYLFVTFGSLTMDAMMKISPELLQGIYGGLFAGIDPLEGWLITLFVHPLVLVLFGVVTVAVTSRTLAGEVDRGTVDLLLSCPVPRWALVCACAVVLFVALATMSLVVWWSLRLGLWIGAIEPPDSLPAFRLVTLNLFALFAAAAGVGLWISAANSEYGKATARTLGFLILSFFVNVIASLWDRVAWLDVVSIFHYHQPQPIISGTADLPLHFGPLFGLAMTGFVAALVVFSRRDITTV